MAEAALEQAPLPDMKISVRQVFGIDSDLEVPAYSEADEHVPGHRSGLPLRPRDDAGDPRRLRPQPPRPGHRLSRHRQVDPYRAGRRPPQLAVRARQPRQPHQPYRPDRQGRHRPARRHAGDRVPRRHPALGAEEQHRAVLRRIRRRPPGRDVRHPARAGGLRPADPARPEQGHPPAPGLPPVRHRQHGRPRRHLRASITAPSRSTRARWTAGRSSSTLNYLPHDDEVDIVAAKVAAATATRRAAPSSPRWCASPT